MDTIRHSRFQVPRVRAVELLTGFCVRLVFLDGQERDIDLEPYLHGPIFEPVRSDPRVFAAVRVDEEGDTLVWPNGADIAPETLYGGNPLWAKGEAKPLRVQVRKRRAVRKSPARRRVPA